MDESQKNLTNQINEDTDLSKQYQDILNQYSKELQSSDPQPVAPVETAPVAPPITETPSPVTLPPIDNSVRAAPVAPTFLPPPLTSVPPIIPTAPTPSTVTPQKNIFKYFFILSLLVFFGVFGTIAYTVVNNALNPTKIKVPVATPTTSDVSPAVEKFCEANDKKIPVGDTFPAADSCNTCTCGEDMTISCTEKDCSAAPTPELSFSIPKNWKTYKDKTYTYQYSCPPEYKQSNEITSTNGKTIPLKQEKCTLGEKFFQVEVWDKEASLESGLTSEIKDSANGKYKFKLSGEDQSFFEEVVKSFK